MMTKKDFIALADAVRTLRPGPLVSYKKGLEAFDQWLKTIESLADFCTSQNPRFNRERWIGYINGENGPNGGAVK